MPLHVPPAPAPALRSVLAALGSPTAVREARTPALRSVQGPLSPELPLPVHVLDRIVAERRRRPAPASTGWRFLIRSGDRAVAAADTMLTPDGWAFSHFFEGPYVASTERALRQAESLSTPTSRGCCPSRSSTCSTLWLHGDTDADASAGTPAADGPAGAAGPRAAGHRRAPAAPGRRSAAGDDPAAHPGPAARLTGLTAAASDPLRARLDAAAPRDPSGRGAHSCPSRTSPFRPPRTTRKDSGVGLNRPPG